MDEERDSPQFWLHSASTGASTRRKSSSNFFNSTLLMLIVAIPALLLMLFGFSSVLSSTSQIMKPNLVRKSWDSINVFLVLFAIVCGIFARWNEDVGSNSIEDLEIPVEQVSNEIPPQETASPTSSYELRWYDLSYESQMRTTASGSGRLRRNSSSYPDLRQQSDWETTGSHGFKYYDDFEISRFNHSLETQLNGIVGGRGITRENRDPDAKAIPVHTYSRQPDLAAERPSLQENPPSQRPPTTQQTKTRVNSSVPKRERSGIENATRAASHQRTQKEDRGSLNPIKTSLTSQTKPPRRRKVRRDVPVKEETDTNSASESSSKPAPPQSPPPVHPTLPIEEEYIRPTPNPSSQLNPPLPPKPGRATWTALKKETEIITEIETAPLSSQSPSPPPPPPTPIQPDQNLKPGKKEKKKSSAKKEIAMVWASIYKRKKKQNQPQQQQLGRVDSGNYNGISQLFSEPEPEIGYTSTSQLFPPPSPAPPPPPPPPPHSVFHSLFKKSATSKSKKIHSVAAPPPPPPPPPRQSFSSTPDNTSQPRTSTGKPPLPKRQINYMKSEYGYLINSGSQSPLFDIPRPPPLPPFGVPDTKFVVRGDYAKIKSNTSSRSESPEPYVFDDDDESLSSESVSGKGARATASYCPSPDVNAKADTFIARLRGEWRLEKMNSVNEKTTTRMGFGPSTGSG